MSDRLKSCQVHVKRRLIDALQSIDRAAVQIAFVIDDDNRVLGTMTDGDVRRALLHGAQVEAPLEPFVTRDFVHVGPEIGRAEVLELMQARAVGQVPVIDCEGRLAGLHLLAEMIGTIERPNWAVIMAGGQGMRLRPLTEHLPKAMIPVAGRPILERLVLQLVGYGVRRIFIAVNYLAHVIEEHFGDGQRFGCTIEYLREPRPLGTGGPLSLLPEPASAPVLALNGDLVAQFDVHGILTFHESGRFVASMAIHDYTHTVPFGVAELDGNRVVALREKPTVAWRTNAGIYVLDPSLLERVPVDREFPLPELIASCLERGEPVGAFPLEGDWIDIGRTGELRRARGEAPRNLEPAV